jgi:hypothetical protein
VHLTKSDNITNIFALFFFLDIYFPFNVPCLLILGLMSEGG